MKIGKCEQKFTKICGTTTKKYKKLGSKTKNFKTLSYIKQQSTKLLGTMTKKYKRFVESKNENFRSSLLDKFCTFWHCTKAKFVLQGRCTKS
jgi:hypothetical protein